jgi:hypothetical protein
VRPVIKLPDDDRHRHEASKPVSRCNQDACCRSRKLADVNADERGWGCGEGMAGMQRPMSGHGGDSRGGWQGKGRAEAAAAG